MCVFEDRIEKEDSLVLTYWEFSTIAASLEESKKLIRDRDYYFDELYEGIRMTGSCYSDGADPYIGSIRVEDQALEILDAKNAYDLRIKKLQGKYERWKAFLKKLLPEDALIIRMYFEQQVKVNQNLLVKAVNRSVDYWTRESIELEQKKDEAVFHSFVEYRKKHGHPDKSNTLKEKPKRKYKINGKLVAMTEEEYAAHEQKKKDRITAALAEIQSHRANETSNAL